MGYSRQFLVKPGKQVKLAELDPAFKGHHEAHAGLVQCRKREMTVIERWTRRFEQFFWTWMIRRAWVNSRSRRAFPRSSCAMRSFSARAGSALRPRRCGAGLSPRPRRVGGATSRASRQRCAYGAAAPPVPRASCMRRPRQEFAASRWLRIVAAWPWTPPPGPARAPRRCLSSNWHGGTPRAHIPGARPRHVHRARCERCQTRAAHPRRCARATCPDRARWMPCA